MWDAHKSILPPPRLGRKSGYGWGEFRHDFSLWGKVKREKKVDHVFWCSTIAFGYDCCETVPGSGQCALAVCLQLFVLVQVSFVIQM